MGKFKYRRWRTYSETKATKPKNIATKTKEEECLPSIRHAKINAGVLSLSHEHKYPVTICVYHSRYNLLRPTNKPYNICSKAASIIY